MKTTLFLQRNVCYTENDDRFSYASIGYRELLKALPNIDWGDDLNVRNFECATRYTKLVTFYEYLDRKCAWPIATLEYEVFQVQTENDCFSINNLGGDEYMLSARGREELAKLGEDEQALIPEIIDDFSHRAFQQSGEGSLEINIIENYQNGITRKKAVELADYVVNYMTPHDTIKNVECSFWTRTDEDGTIWIENDLSEAGVFCLEIKAEEKDGEAIEKFFSRIMEKFRVGKEQYETENVSSYIGQSGLTKCYFLPICD